jgi:hypothetical protein
MPDKKQKIDEERVREVAKTTNNPKLQKSINEKLKHIDKPIKK